MDRIFLTGSTARGLRRLVRMGKGFGGDLRLSPTDVSRIDSPLYKRATASSLGLDGVRQALRLVPGQPLEALVGSSTQRRRIPGIRFHVRRSGLPSGSFERLEGASPTGHLLLPKGIEVFVESASLSFVSAAGQLDTLVSAGRVSRIEAQLRLLKLGVEDCSTFVVNPWVPQEGAYVYDVRPVLRACELVRYVKEVRGIAGICQARQVAAWVYDNAASEMELLVRAGLCLPAHLGGLGLEAPVANKEIPLDELQQLALNHIDHITPDLFWEALGIIIEYLGDEPHTGKEAQDEDMGRVQDYQVLGYCVLPVRFDHVRNATAFNRLARRLAVAMEERGRWQTCAWVDELTSDQSFLAVQRELFKVLLPAVRDR